MFYQQVGDLIGVLLVQTLLVLVWVHVIIEDFPCTATAWIVTPAVLQNYMILVVEIVTLRCSPL